MFKAKRSSFHTLTRLRTLQKLGFGDLDFALGFERTSRQTAATAPRKLIIKIPDSKKTFAFKVDRVWHSIARSQSNKRNLVLKKSKLVSNSTYPANI